MAQAKVTKRKPSSKKFVIKKPWHKQPLFFAVLFAIIAGGILLFKNYALTPSVLTGANDLVLEKTITPGAVKEIKDANGVITELVPTTQVRLYGNGLLVCGQSNTPELTQTTLSSGKLNDLVSKVRAKGFETLPKQIDNRTGNVARLHSEDLTLNLSNKTYKSQYYSGTKSAAFADIEQLLNEACAQAANKKPIRQQQLPVLNALKLSVNTNSKRPIVDNLLGSLNNFVFKRVFAEYFNQHDEDIQYNDINAQRGGRQRSGCLTNSARAWSQSMGDRHTLEHGDWQSRLSNYCGGNWTIRGENVGTTSGCDYYGDETCSQTVFNAFMNSDGHRANIQDARFNYVGVGVYRKTDGSIWVTQDFAGCNSGCGTFASTPSNAGPPPARPQPQPQPQPQQPQPQPTQPQPQPQGAQPVTNTGAVTQYSSKKCLDVNASGTSNGTQVQLWDCHGGANQQWTLYSDATLRPSHATNKCLDVNNAYTGNGGNLMLYDCHAGSNQRWAFTSSKTIQGAGSGRCLVTPNGSANSGSPIITWDCGTDNSYKWTQPGASIPPPCSGLSKLLLLCKA